MILTDREIQIALQTGVLKIEPRPKPDAVSSTSVDLTLGRDFAVWSSRPGMTICPGAKGFKYTDYIDLQEKRTGAHVLQPQSFVLGWTAERVQIPINSRLAARVEGKSSMARLGVGIHVTAPTIHSGFEGQVQLEIFNFGPNSIQLDEGMRICQLIFEQTLGTPEKGYAGLFIGQEADKLGA
jgi:dCTP deaminase